MSINDLIAYALSMAVTAAHRETLQIVNEALFGGATGVIVLGVVVFVICAAYLWET